LTTKKEEREICGDRKKKGKGSCRAEGQLGTESCGGERRWVVGFFGEGGNWKVAPSLSRRTRGTDRIDCSLTVR